MRAWTLLVIKTRQLLSERESHSAMIICRVWAKRFFQFPVMFTNNKKWRSTSWLTMFNSLFSFPTFLLFSPFRLVRSNTWVQWKHLTPERSIDLCLQTFLKLLLLLVPKVTTRSLYPECIANLKLPIDAFYRESRSGVNIAKRNITTGLFGLMEAGFLSVYFSIDDVHPIGKPRVSPLRFLNTSAVIRYLICVYASHFFAGRPYHFNQTLRTANKF
jgi:hypothetical protein